MKRFLQWYFVGVSLLVFGVLVWIGIQLLSFRGSVEAGFVLIDSRVDCLEGRIGELRDDEPPHVAETGSVGGRVGQRVVSVDLGFSSSEGKNYAHIRGGRYEEGDTSPWGVVESVSRFRVLCRSSDGRVTRLVPKKGPGSRTLVTLGTKQFVKVHRPDGSTQLVPLKTKGQDD